MRAEQDAALEKFKSDDHEREVAAGRVKKSPPAELEVLLPGQQRHSTSHGQRQPGPQWSNQVKRRSKAQGQEVYEFPCGKKSP